MIIYGINPVLEALASGRVRRVRISGGGERLAAVQRAARARGIAVEPADRATLDRLAEGASHQGVVADVEPARVRAIEELLHTLVQPALLVVLDGIEDPQNLGAILRTADAAGVHGVVRQTRHAAALGAAAARASAGALHHVTICDVVNVARALEQLKAAGIWTVGLAGDGDRRYDQIDYTVPTAFVLGGEGQGLRRLVRERCDWLASIPMQGAVSSLNVSVAAGVALFEAVRQRLAKGA